MTPESICCIGPATANLEKFVEIGTHNGQKPDAFEQGMPRILGLLEHTPVKKASQLSSRLK